VQYEGEPFGGAQRVQHHQQGGTDGVGLHRVSLDVAGWRAEVRRRRFGGEWR